jgi:2-keto-4-pentenoate hydratase
MNATIEPLAQALADAWRRGGTIPLPATPPATRAEAYAIQDRMAARIGGRVVGWKVGATVRAVQIFEGHDGPLPGRIFADRCFESPARMPLALLPGAKAECEFAFRLTQPLAAAARPFTPEGIAGALAFHPALELAASRYAPGTGNRAARTFDGIADNGSGGGAVLGPAIADWRRLDFETLPIEARLDASPPIQAYSGAYRRDPLAIMAETLEDLAARGLYLAAGDCVLTGSLTLPTPVRAGQTLVARFADLATVSASFI